VDGVTFKNSQVVDSSNGCRIKSNSETTGSVSLSPILDKFCFVKREREREREEKTC
jgi:hypothetical protein